MVWASDERLADRARNPAMRDLLTQQELKELLSREEGQFLEFKSLWDRQEGPPKALDRRSVRDWIAEYAAAFANADGGTIILGVDDDGTPSGHEYPEEAVAGFLAVPQTRLRPPIETRSQQIQLGGCRLIVIVVPMHPVAVMVEGNGFPRRVGDQVVREPQDVINNLKQSYRSDGYEQRIHPGATIRDLDLELAGSFLSRTVYRDRPVEEVLRQYALVVPNGNGTAVTNAALLLFGKAPMARWHPRAGIRLFRVRGAARQHGTRRNVSQVARIELAMAAAIPAAHKATSAQIPASEKLHDLFFREMPEYPEFAWQEAIVNAFAHRDYNDRGREIEVWFFDDRMEVTNPGDLLPPVTLDQLRQRRRIHASRNPLIVRVLADAGIMREEGEGIPRMFEEMEDSYLRPPEFEVEGSEFRVVLRNVPIFEGGDPQWRALVEKLALSASQKRALIAHPDGFTNEDYRRLSGADRDQAYREIQEMVNKGVVLASSARGRGAVYQLSPDLHEMRAWLEGRLDRLRDHFRRNAKLTNTDYRTLFGVTRHTAGRELRRLTAEGFLELVGQRRGSRYLPGRSLLAERAE